MTPQIKILLGGLGLGLCACALNLYLMLSESTFHRYSITLAFLGPMILVASALGLILRPRPSPEKTSPVGWIILVCCLAAGALNVYLMMATSFYENLFSVSVPQTDK